MIQTPSVSGEGSKEARNHSFQGPLNFGVIGVCPLPYSFADFAGAIIAVTGHVFNFSGLGTFAIEALCIA